jgi:ribose-phosphate pyrophosphokinase
MASSVFIDNWAGVALDQIQHDNIVRDFGELSTSCTRSESDTIPLATSIVGDDARMLAAKKIKLIVTNSNGELGESLASKLGIDKTDILSKKHSNSEIKVQVLKSVRGEKVYICASGTNDKGGSVNDYLMEVLFFIDACKKSCAKSIYLIIPCYPYARADKKDDGRTTIGGAFVARMLEEAGVSRIVSVDLHATQIQGFTSLPFDNIEAIKLFMNYLKMNLFGGLSHEEVIDRFLLVSPDVGGASRVRKYAEHMKMPFAIMNKQRDYTKESVVLNSELVGRKGMVGGKTAIIIDDIIDTAGTMVAAATTLQENGATNVIILATHGVLSGPAVERINSCDFISSVVVTNSLPQKDNLAICPKLEVIDLGTLLSEVIIRMETRRSVSKVFKF